MRKKTIQAHQSDQTRPFTSENSQNYASALMDAALDCIILMDHDGKILEFNPAAERTFGYRRNEAIGREMAELIIPPAFRESHRLGLARYLATGEGPAIDTRLELTGWRADGTEFPVELTITRLPSEDPPVMAGFLRDITERKLDERRLAAHHALSHALVESDTEEEMAVKVLAALGRNLDWESSVFWQVKEQPASGNDVTPLIATALWHRREAQNSGSENVLAVDDAVWQTTIQKATRDVADQAAKLPEGVGIVWQEFPLGASEDRVAETQVPVANSIAVAASPSSLAVLAFPVRHTAQVVGVIAFCSRDMQLPDQEQLRMVEALGSEVGQFLRRKRLEAELRRSYNRQTHIAEWLQEALRPALISSTPGLDVYTYYRPALDEASIGGDFFDAFILDRNSSALVVADLSGKGVVAAAQIATVRHMLRAMLYEHIYDHDRSLAQVITKLNAMLADHELLRGFATLFAGVFDADQRTLTYCSCGQEPGLILRQATGLVEEMAPTGPILGGFSGASFEERVVSLVPEDLIALFTDGLTEAGRSRKDLLGVPGVTALLQKSAGEPGTVKEITARIMAGVEAVATRGGIRDDACLLVARVE